jgi:prolyl oligopeptidase
MLYEEPRRNKRRKEHLMSSQNFLTEFVTPEFLAANKPHRQGAVDEYHGTNIADPYRWLEDLSDPETQAWIAEQKNRTNTYFQTLPGFQQILAELTAIWDYPKYTVPEKHAERYFFGYNSGLQHQYVFLMQEGLHGVPRVIFDPNTKSSDGTIAVHTTFYSHDGTLMAYGLSESGSDWQDLHIRRIDDGYEYPEVLHWTRYSQIAWLPDNAGFYYSRYPATGTVAPEDQTHFQRVYFHQLGTPQAADRLVFEQPEAKERLFYPRITDDGVYLLLRVTQGTAPENRWYYRSVDSDGPFIRLLDKADANYRFLGNEGTRFYFLTTLDAPRGRIIGIDLRFPEREHWYEILPQHEKDVLHFARMVNNLFAVVSLRDVHHVLSFYTLDGRFLRDVPLPPGSITALSGEAGDHELFFRFTSFLTPGTTYRYDFVAETLEVFRQTECHFDASPYITSQVFYASKDGTRIPMFLVHKKDIVLDGTNPTLLYGYGGFRISQLPEFSLAASFWLEHGGIYAVANLRGGNEYGEEWHQAGILERKQNVFDDYIAAAEWLIAQGYTAPSRLAIHGGSNGGLLVAACLVQRPDLFGAVVCRNPLTDMLRYHRLTVGHYWTAEYGNAETSAEHFQLLSAYSPLHNVKPGAYPPTLILTADSDDRVSPAHALKFAAALQEASDGTHPILLHVQSKAGHGAGKPTGKIIEQWAMIFAFLFDLFQIA